MIAFKPRSRSVQVVRQRLDADSDASSEVLGTLKLPSYAPDAALAAKLAQDEAKQVSAYAERCLDAERIARAHAAYSLPEALRLATDWLKAADKDQALTFVEEVKVPFSKLRRLVAKIAVNEADGFEA